MPRQTRDSKFVRSRRNHSRATRSETLVWQSKSTLNSKPREKELGVADELKGIPGLTTLMLVAFGERGIKPIEDLAGCATDDLCGWIEDTSGTPTRHEGILHRFSVSRGECDTIILYARIKAGWI